MPETTAVSENTPAAAPDVAALQKQIDDLKAENAEKDRAAQFWHEKATARAEPAKATREDKEDDKDDDVLEAITVGGAKGLDALLAKRGYVRGEEVDKRVNAKAAALQQEQQLIAEYPDLKKKDSEFFKATAIRYGELIKADVAPGVAMRMAAESTELAFLREGKLQTPAEQKAEKDRERKARATAAGGEHTTRTQQGDPEDDELTPQQMRIVRSMLVGSPGKDGKPMDEAAAVEVYKTRAKAGVQMKGIR